MACVFLLGLLPMLAGCMVEPGMNESPPGPPVDPGDSEGLHPLGGTPNPRHHAEVTLRANQTPNDLPQNITAHIRITNLTGDAAEEGVEPIRILLLSESRRWEAVPEPGPGNGTWQALDGPRWRIGSLVNVTLDVDIAGEYTRIFEDVEVKAAEAP